MPEKNLKKKKKKNIFVRRYVLPLKIVIFAECLRTSLNFSELLIFSFSDARKKFKKKKKKKFRATLGFVLKNRNSCGMFENES